MVKKIFIGVVVLLVIGVGMNAIIDAARRVGVNQGYEPEQPIHYSHKLHAGDHQIPCLYCHFGAEKGRHAGIPPANVCMNCHTWVKRDSPEIKKIKEAIANNKPIEWIKVHYLPDFVYFNHSQHVVVGKVACQECHGPIQAMTRVRQENTLSMGWCIDCHRTKGVLPPEGHVDSSDPDAREKVLNGLDCQKCHY